MPKKKKKKNPPPPATALTDQFLYYQHYAVCQTYTVPSSSLLNPSSPSSKSYALLPNEFAKTLFGFAVSIFPF